jgi:glycosyltransferase involved in cell wall biosynthesis
LAQFDHVVANSAFNLRDLQQHIPGGLAPERTSVVPPISARFPLFARPARSPRPVPAQPGQPLHLLTVGRVVPHKRIEDLIEVVALLAQQGQAAHLHVVGSSHNADYRALLDRTIQTHGLQAHVHLHGMVSDADLAQQYEVADVLLVASLHEGFCVPVLEAMHLGLPVVLRSGTAAGEVAAEAGQAFDEPDQAAATVLNLVRSADLAEAMVKAGFNRSLQLLSAAQWALNP